MKKFNVACKAIAIFVAVALSIFAKGNDANTVISYWYSYDISTDMIDLLPDGNIPISEWRAENVTGCGPMINWECARAYVTPVIGFFPQFAPAGAIDYLYNQ